MKKKFKNWIDTFIEEKDLPMNETIMFNELKRVVFTIYGKK